MDRDRDWKKVFHKKFVQHYIGVDSYNFHGFGDDAPYKVDGTEEVDKVIDFIKQEKEKSRKETLEEVKGKFGGGVIIGIGDNDLGVKVPEIRVPELDKWVEEELSKLNK